MRHTCEMHTVGCIHVHVRTKERPDIRWSLCMKMSNMLHCSWRQLRRWLPFHWLRRWLQETEEGIERIARLRFSLSDVLNMWLAGWWFAGRGLSDRLTSRLRRQVLLLDIDCTIITRSQLQHSGKKDSTSDEVRAHHEASASSITSRSISFKYDITNRQLQVFRHKISKKYRLRESIKASVRV